MKYFIKFTAEYVSKLGAEKAEEISIQVEREDFEIIRKAKEFRYEETESAMPVYFNVPQIEVDSE